MTSQADIGVRARAAIRGALPGLSQAQVADRVGMTPDALSRALNGQRAFASIELARLAELTGVDLHELITGEPDPNKLTFVARHTFDKETRERYVPGRAEDEDILRDLELVYRQAGSLPASPAALTSPSKVRAEIGDSFIRKFADLVERHLGIDVVRVPGLSTAYSFTVSGRNVIAIPAVGNWFWENWSLAHELGHFALGHHDAARVTKSHEREADDFAAELLLPEHEMRARDWLAIAPRELAQLVWDYGVSTKAIGNRVNALGLAHAELIDVWAAQTTQKLLRHHLPHSWHGQDEITIRMAEAATRRFPLELQNAHIAGIASGAIGKGALAWMLDVDVDALEVETPVPASAPDLDELAVMLGLTDAP
jgi:Zn-dependent peptidase ImmA (M78 family)/transcriptional regulator with XRE-family HTH domain